jgi:DNA-binding NarL/FixJ family response regulator
MFCTVKKMSLTPKIRIAIAEDHPEMRLVLGLLVRFYADLELVCEVSNGQEAVDCARRLQPDLLVMDIRMPVLDGLAATKQILEAAPGTKVILISSDVGKYVDSKVAGAGAHGYVPKDLLAKELYRAIRAVHSGDIFFLH